MAIIDLNKKKIQRQKEAAGNQQRLRPAGKSAKDLIEESRQGQVKREAETILAQQMQDSIELADSEEPQIQQYGGGAKPQQEWQRGQKK
ncbi:MAG: hypothetical protein Q8N37_00095, partial [bacterium]|nr:hypothetical protein [bacterium]